MNNRVGEKKTMKNGLIGTIVKYQNKNNIVVRFDDGSETKTNYQAFKRGWVRCLSIPNIQIINRVGETRKMTNGLLATILKYERAHDILVRFENGEIVNTQYDNFKLGKVNCSGCHLTTFKDRTGETKVMKNGLRATITKYDGVENVVVRFENGAEVSGKYGQFRAGGMRSPLIFDYTYKDSLGPGVKVINPNIADCWWLMSDKHLGLLDDQLWCIDGQGYVVCTKYGFLHRRILNAPPNLQVDHIHVNNKFNRRDNREDNIRLVTAQQNVWNMRIHSSNSSGYIGVHRDGRTGKWHSSMRRKGTTKAYLGSYSSPELAAYAYNMAITKYRDNWTRPNIIPYEHIVASLYSGGIRSRNNAIPESLSDLYENKNAFKMTYCTIEERNEITVEQLDNTIGKLEKEKKVA